MEKYSLEELKYYENYLRYLKKYYESNLTKSLSRKL